MPQTSHVGPLGGALCSDRQKKFCDKLLNADGRVCNRLKTLKGNNLCWASASERYGNCLAGKSLPELVTWGDD